MEFDKEIVTAQIKDMLSEIDMEKEKRDYGHIYLWGLNRWNTKDYFDIVFRYFNQNEIGAFMGCSGEFIQNTRRSKGFAPLPFHMFVKMLKIKLYLIMITQENMEEMY